MRLLDGAPYDASISTDIRRRFKAEGFTPPEHSAAEAEQQASYEGALRAMLKIQSEAPKASVTPIRKTTTKE